MIKFMQLDLPSLLIITMDMYCVLSSSQESAQVLKQISVFKVVLGKGYGVTKAVSPLFRTLVQRCPTEIAYRAKNCVTILTRAVYCMASY